MNSSSDHSQDPRSTNRLRRVSQRYMGHPVVRNAIALYGIQFAEYALPMVSVPYLARVLQPSGWGLVVLAQGVAGWLSLVLEYGFGFSATREIARKRDDHAGVAEVVAGVMGANVLLLAGALVALMAVWWTMPALRNQPVYLLLSWIIALTQGIRPLWFFQGYEQMRFPALMNVTGRLLFTIGIFLLVKTTADGWKVLALQAGTGAMISVVLAIAMYRRLPFVRPTLAQSVDALRMGWTVFLSRSAVSLYTLANTYILGVFQRPEIVAFYGGAERANRAVLGLLQPVSQALYPRMSRLAASQREKAEQTARLGLLVFGAFGLAAGVGCALLAPWIVRVLLGRNYSAAVPVFRVLSMVVPLVALSNILGTQWMLPFGLDRLFNRIILGAGLLNLVVAMILAPRFGAVGMAWSVALAEAFVTVAMWVALEKKGHGIWSSRTKGAPLAQ